MDDFQDEIAKWAESLTPEGSPGTLQQKLRQMYGDNRYEIEMARQDRIATLYIRRTDLINRVVSACLFYIHLLGLALTAVLIALVVKITIG